MQNDPYTTPVTIDQSSGHGGGSQVTLAVLHQLAGTKPWVRFFSVLMFIGAAFMLLGALGLALAGSALAKSSGNPMFSGGMGVGIALLYAVLSIIYIYPALKLWKYANSIRDLQMSGSELDLVAALNHQRSFWKFVGILMLAVLALYIVVVIGAIIVTAIAAANARP